MNNQAQAYTTALKIPTLSCGRQSTGNKSRAGQGGMWGEKMQKGDLKVAYGETSTGAWTQVFIRKEHLTELGLSAWEVSCAPHDGDEVADTRIRIAMAISLHNTPEWETMLDAVRRRDKCFGGQDPKTGKTIILVSRDELFAANAAITAAKKAVADMFDMSVVDQVRDEKEAAERAAQLVRAEKAAVERAEREAEAAAAAAQKLKDEEELEKKVAEWAAEAAAEKAAQEAKWAKKQAAFVATQGKKTIKRETRVKEAAERAAYEAWEGTPPTPTISNNPFAALAALKKK